MMNDGRAGTSTSAREDGVEHLFCYRDSCLPCQTDTPSPTGGTSQNVVFQGFTGSGKSYLGCALAKQACTHRIRAHYIRMPDLAEAWALARDKPNGSSTFLKKYAAFTLLVLDEWLLDPPDEGMRVRDAFRIAGFC